jgi:hypothetical protein
MFLCGLEVIRQLIVHGLLLVGDRRGKRYPVVDRLFVPNRGLIPQIAPFL